MFPPDPQRTFTVIPKRTMTNGFGSPIKCLRPTRLLAAALALVIALLASSLVAPRDARATISMPEFPPLTVTQLTPPFPAVGSTVAAVDLDNADRTLVYVDNGVEVAAYLVSGTSWARVANFKPTAFATIGFGYQQDVIVGNRGADLGGYQAFLTVDGLEHAIQQRSDTRYSTIVNDVNRSGTVVGQFAKGNFWHAFEIDPEDADHDGLPDTWFKDEKPADGVNDLFVDLGEAYNNGAAASIATAINDNGMVVGIHDTGVAWQPFGTGGGPGARPNDISNSNQVVGLNMITQQALLFPSTVLDGTGGFGNSNAVSINNDEEIVGTSAKAGFYYDSAHGMVALNDRVPNASDRHGFSPTKINDNGVIAANADNHAFLLRGITNEPCAGVAARELACVSPTADFSAKVSPGGIVKVDASGSKAVPPATITGYEWSVDNGSGVSSPLPTLTRTVTSTKPVTVSLVVADSNGRKSAPVTRDVDPCAVDEPAANGVEYSWLVKCVEDRIAASPRRILSLMRQFYFGTQEWTTKNRNTVWNDAIPCGDQSVPDPRPVLPEKLQTALSNASSSVAEADISHVFTGLEAAECPSQQVRVTPPPDLAAGLPSLFGAVWTVQMPNYAFVSWGGDVGQAVVSRTADARAGITLSPSYYLGPGGTAASARDLNGDVDGLVLHFAVDGSPCTSSLSPTSWTTRAAKTPPLSSVLKSYYDRSSGAYATRMLCFTRILGVPRATPTNGLARRYTGSVASFSRALYLGRASRRLDAFAHPVAVLQSLAGNSVTFTRLFGDWIASQP